MLAVGRGGMDASFKLTRQEIAAAYDAGRDAVIALVEGVIERQEQRLAALEQELQELKQDSHDSGKPPSRDSFARKQLKRRSSRRERTDKRQPGGQPEHPGYDAAASGATGSGHDPCRGAMRVWSVTG